MVGKKLMKVKETNVDGLKREFKVVVPSTDIEAKISDRLKEISKTVKLPGFRAGKVPEGLLRQRYEPSIRIEVLDDLVRNSTTNLIQEKDLRPAVQPKIEIVSSKKGEDLEFGLNLEIMPEIELKTFDGIKVSKKVADVPEKDVEKAVERIAETRKSSEPIKGNRALKSGDIAVIDFLGRVGGVAFDGGKGEDYYLEIGSQTFIPGFEDQLIGKKAGEETEVKVTFPKEYRSKDLAGKDSVFEVKVKEIRETKKSEVNDELAKSIGYENLDKMKEAIKERINQEYEMLARTNLKRELLDALAEQYNFDVPESMLEAEFRAIWQQYENAKKYGNLDAEDAKKDEKELKDEYKNIAKRRVMLGLLFSEIGHQNKIEVSQEDLSQAIFNEAMRFPGQEKAIFEYYRKNPNALEAVKAPIYEDKVVDFILDKVKVTEVKVEPEELYNEEGQKASKPKKASSKKAKETKDEAEAKPKAETKKKTTKAKKEE